MGFSHSLLLLINQVAELARNQTDNQKSTQSTAVSKLRKSLEGLDQVLPSQCDDPNTECAAIAEANRLGALLLLQEICSIKSALPSNLRQQSTGTQEKAHYVKLILDLMLEKKANMMRTAVLPLWPLFLAGCCASKEEERITVMQFFDEVEGIHRFGVCVSSIPGCTHEREMTDYSRMSRLLWKLLKWSGDSRICLYKTKGSAKGV
jgi:hypothetical protein